MLGSGISDSLRIAIVCMLRIGSISRISCRGMAVRIGSRMFVCAWRVRIRIRMSRRSSVCGRDACASYVRSSRLRDSSNLAKFWPGLRGFGFF